VPETIIVLIMQIYRLKSLDREKQIYLLALILSLLLHIIFILVFKTEFFIIDLTSDDETITDDVTVIFPENKAKQIVENINENDDTPFESDLLSDRNSRSRNQMLLEERLNQPFSEGNNLYPNLTNPNFSPALSQNIPSKKFSKDALSSNNDEASLKDYTGLDRRGPFRNAVESTQLQQMTNNIYKQNKFSADQLGDMSLSTYAWEWAPYINALKRKLYQVWFTPAAYYRLGLIHGYTIIQFSISREGQLIEYEVLEHEGHESLEQSSVNAIKSSFPFKPLPVNFPDENLTIVARLIYPNLRERAN
jgi:hypothetical protein